MRLFFGKYYFAPKWYFILGTICLCVLFIRLGYWQLQRAAEKENLQATFSARLNVAPLSLEQLSDKASDMLYYPVKITGYYDNAHTILLDNKIHAHRVGYEILTPFIANQNQRMVLINRGWVSAATNRSVLPKIPAVKGEQTVIGYVYITPGKPFTLGHETQTQEAWPLRMQTLDIAAVENKLHQPIYPFVLLLSPDASAGFVRDWQPVTMMSAQKHRGYAVQWFAFATVLVIIFIALSIRKSSARG